MTDSNSPFVFRFMILILALMLIAVPLFPALWMLGSGTMPIWL